MRTINIGLVGLGTVGGGVAKLINTHHDQYLEHYGIDLNIKLACGLDDSRLAELGIPREKFTYDWKDVVADPDIDIVIEVIGGTHPAMDIFEAAFASGKHMITANKALLGRNMEHLASMAAANGVQLRCEAAAAGGIPVVHAIEHDLMGNSLLTIAGIMNGTTNYILSRMRNEGLPFDEVLAAAQALGYAEANPTADVDGFDAASKLAILSSIGFCSRVTTDDVYMQGIRDVAPIDMKMADDMGYVIKLLAIARRTDAGVSVRVHPTMIPKGHQLAAVDGAMNAVYVVGDAVGETMFYGAGAGAFPTASAVVGDVFALAEQISAGIAPKPESEPYQASLPLVDMAQLETRYYVRLDVENQPGVLAQATKAFADNGISISNISQVNDSETGATLIFVTHVAKEGALQQAVATLENLDVTSGKAAVIRVEDVSTWKEGAFAN